MTFSTVLFQFEALFSFKHATLAGCAEQPHALLAQDIRT